MRKLVAPALGVIGGFITSSLFGPRFAVALAVYTAVIIYVTFELTQRSILKSSNHSEQTSDEP